MKTTIGKFDPTTRAVAVTFTQGDVVHTRSVNACLDADGGYDQADTKARVADVGLGVAVKIGIGAIANPVDEPDAA